MTQKSPQSRISAVNAKSHRFFHYEEYKAVASDEYLRKYRNLVSS